MGNTLRWFDIVWLLSMTMNVKSQCSTKDENFNSPDGGPFFSSEEVVPLEMLVDMIEYLLLPGLTATSKRRNVLIIRFRKVSWGWTLK